MGTAKFINNTANAIASGYSPYVLMRYVRMPTPIANHSRPFGLVAPETGSVRIKNAAKIAAPAMRWIRTGVAVSGSKLKNALTTASVTKSPTGVCHVMTRR